MDYPQKSPRFIGTVGVYSPSGSFSDKPEKMLLFEKGVARLKALGFEVRESTHCRASWYHASASPADRAADLNELLMDPNVDIILPSIGGHVASQLLPLIDYKKVATSGKKLFGFSDNAIIPVVTTSTTGSLTYHTLCDVTFGFGRFTDVNYTLTEASFLRCVRDRMFDLAGDRTWRIVQDGDTQGVILGGNLKGLTSLSGTSWWPDWRGKIMFWESADPLHAVVQHLVHLSNAGAFDQLAGMIIGKVSTLKETFYQSSEIIPIETLLFDVLGLHDRFPIVIEANIGHDVENITIPLGARAKLQARDIITCTVEMSGAKGGNL